MLWLLIYIILFVFGCNVNALLYCCACMCGILLVFGVEKIRFCCMFSFRPQRYNFFLRYARNMPKKSFPHYFLIISSPFLCCLCYWIPLSSLSPKLSKLSLTNHCLHCLRSCLICLELNYCLHCWYIYPFSAQCVVLRAMCCWFMLLLLL